MFIAHLPAGYVLTRRLIDRAPAGDALSRRLLALGLWASVLPNLDLLYFYLIDNRQTLHHLYWPHVPVSWLAPAALSLLF
jgi:inner membrane protein